MPWPVVPRDSFFAVDAFGLAGGVGGRYFADDEAVAGSNPARVAIPGSSVVEHLVFVRATEQIPSLQPLVPRP